MGLIEEHIQLAKKIVGGELSKTLVIEEINRIEKEYGEDAFNSFVVKKKSSPWTQKDLDDLEMQSASGAGSKEFYLYMAEVSEFVHKKDKRQGFFAVIECGLKFIARYWLKILCTVLIIALVCGAFALVYWVIAKFIR